MPHIDIQVMNLFYLVVFSRLDCKKHAAYFSQRSLLYYSIESKRSAVVVFAFANHVINTPVYLLTIFNTHALKPNNCLHSSIQTSVLGLFLCASEWMQMWINPPLKSNLYVFFIISFLNLRISVSKYKTNPTKTAQSDFDFVIYYYYY